MPLGSHTCLRSQVALISRLLGSQLGVETRSLFISELTSLSPATPPAWTGLHCWDAGVGFKQNMAIFISCQSILMDFLSAFADTMAACTHRNWCCHVTLLVCLSLVLCELVEVITTGTTPKNGYIIFKLESAVARKSAILQLLFTNNVQ